jgi:hypothetical protein
LMEIRLDEGFIGDGAIRSRLHDWWDAKNHRN